MTVDTISYATLIDQLSAEHAELLPWVDRILALAAGANAELREAVASGADT